MAIPIRKPHEIEALRSANKIVAETLQLLREEAKEGVSLQKLDSLAENYIRSKGGRPSFKGLYNFPSSVCTSVNEVVIHGTPTEYKLKNGDIVGFDIGVELNGWYGDSAITIGIGDISENDNQLISCSKDALYHAISTIKVGMRFKELSAELEKFIRSRGFVPLANFCGHGIGRKPHEEPEILNYLVGSSRSGPKIKNGMVFCIEPMVCKKEMESKILSDKWSVVSKDGERGSHYEHTVAVIDGKAEILSKI
ncbi:methionine aminopeptidase, type I [Thiovulum sp. ES]|nr:methionine aminopeptidase, type I [Thiovulum sp. ES]